MATLKELTTAPRGHILVLETDDADGGNLRRILDPDADVSGEVQEIQDLAELTWTDEVKSDWAVHLEKTTPKE